MPHHIYETQGIVLSTTSTGEADRQLLLYTKEFGLIRALAQGVRELKSKLRYSLEPYSLSTLNLVHGKTGWRITSACLINNWYRAFASRPAHLLMLAHICQLLRRMLHGEERDSVLFEIITDGFEFLETLSELSAPDAELVLVLRILYRLGYVSTTPTLSPLLEYSWGAELLSKANHERRFALRSVNESLKASHL